MWMSGECQSLYRRIAPGVGYVGLVGCTQQSAIFFEFKVARCFKGMPAQKEWNSIPNVAIDAPCALTCVSKRRQSMRKRTDFRFVYELRVFPFVSFSACL